MNVLFTNPDADPRGNITLSELKTIPVSVIAFQSPTSASLTAALPVIATLGTQVFNDAFLVSTPTLQLSSNNAYAGSALIRAQANSSFAELQNFKNLTPAGVSTALDRTGRAIEEMASVLNVNPEFGVMHTLPHKPAKLLILPRFLPQFSGPCMIRW